MKPLHPPRGRAWWRIPSGMVCDDGARLWVFRGNDVLVTPMEPIVDVIETSDTILVTHESGAFSRLQEDIWESMTPRSRLAGALLSEGASSARNIWPWPCGRGLLWKADDVLFRESLETAPRAVARAVDRVLAGPNGAFLTGNSECFTHGAAPGRSAVPLPVDLLAKPWGVRWRADGDVVAGLDSKGVLVRLDLRHGRVLERIPGGLPVDADGGVLPTDLREASWALEGHRLAGPGGLVWDLRSGKPLFTEPVVRLGATVAAGTRFATVDWESGDGVWFDPDDGRVLETFHVPLAPEDAVDRAWAEGSAIWVTTVLDCAFRVVGATVEAASEAPSPPVPPTLECGSRARDLGAEAAILFQERVYAWNSDGLLVCFPSSADEARNAIREA